MNPYLSFVIPIYNEEDRLTRCIDSIIRQSNNNNIEIVCVNDGSEDSSSLILEDYEEDHEVIEVITHEENKGYASTISDGLYHAEGEIIVFLDADSYIPGETMEKLIQTFQDGADAVFGRVEVGNQEAGLHPLASAVGKSHGDSANFGGALMGFNRDILLSEGGFYLEAERAGQDVEIRERLTQNGYNVILNEEIIVYSDFPTNMSEVLKRKYLAGKTYVLTFYNNPSGFDISILQGLLFFSIFNVSLFGSTWFRLSGLVTAILSLIFVWFYWEKARHVYQLSDRILYIPAYMIYQFISGELRVAGYISEFPKLASLVSYKLRKLNI